MDVAQYPKSFGRGNSKVWIYRVSFKTKIHYQKVTCISNKGAISIANAMELNSTIVELRMRCNMIYDKAFKFLSRMLKKNNTLRMLDLSGKKLTVLTT